MKNQYIIPAAMVCATILAGIWILKPPSGPQRETVVQPLDKNAKAIKKRLDAGMSANEKVKALGSAAYRGHAGVVELLISEGVNVNAKDKGAETALHKAAVAGQNEMVELPIAEGADVNAQAMRGGGMTPLDMAIHLNKTETADILRKHGGKTGAELKAEGK